MTAARKDPPTLLERAIAYVAPEVALRRARASVALEMVREYDAAAGGRRTQNWRARGTSADAENATALPRVRDRHRDLVRNNPWARKALEVIAGETIAYGIAGDVTTQSKRRSAALGDLWKDWTETCDADGLHAFGGLQDLAITAIAESGEVLLRRRRRRRSDRLPAPLQVQVLEGDHLDHSKTVELTNGGRIVQGVEFNSIGRRVAYWLYRDHPGGVLTKRTESERVDASEVAHVYLAERPGQVRGMPWGRSAYLTMFDLRDFADAYLFRNKLANCLTGFIYDHTPDLSGSGGKTSLPLPEQLEPGLLAGLPAGKDIKFSTPPTTEGYAPYVQEVLYEIAAAYGITYESLTGNLSRTNFASGRMGWLQMGRNIDRWRWRMMVPQFCGVVGRWFLEAAEGDRGLDIGDARFAWTPPRRQIINPAQEIAAIVAAIRAGLMSLPEAHRELGYNYGDVLKEIADSNVLVDQYELVLDSDPRKVSATGLTQARPVGTVLPPTTVPDGTAPSPTTEEPE